MKICVIGSGLSALACVKSLLERKLTDITVIDFGKKISSKIEKNKKILSEISPHNWPENIVEEIKHQHKKNLMLHNILKVIGFCVQ